MDERVKHGGKRRFHDRECSSKVVLSYGEPGRRKKVDSQGCYKWTGDALPDWSWSPEWQNINGSDASLIVDLVSVEASHNGA